MDKNTLTGLLLMLLVIFGFTWLNQPSAEEMARHKAKQDSIAAVQAQKEAQAQQNLTLDSLTANDMLQLKAIVSKYGTANGESVTYRSSVINATLNSGENLSGTVTTADTTVSINDVFSKSVNPKIASAASTAIKNEINNVGRYKAFASAMTGTEEVAVLENNILKVEINSKGAMVQKAVIKNYDSKRNGTKDLVLFNKEDDSYGFILNGSDNRYHTSEFFFKPTQINDSTLFYTLNLADGAKIGIRYTLPKDSYLLKMEMVQENMTRQTAIPSNVTDMSFEWNQKMTRKEMGDRFEENNSAVYYKFTDDSSVESLKFDGEEEKQEDQNIRWIAFKDQFFSSIIIGEQPFTNAKMHTKSYDRDSANGRLYLKQLSAEANLEYSLTNNTPASFYFYFGPNKYKLLNSLDNLVSEDEDLNLTRVIPMGWSIFRWINTCIVIPLFDFLGGFIANYGIIILLMTIIIKIVLFPLAYKSLKSSAIMRVLKPDVDALNEKYPGQENAMIRSQKSMELYSKAGASPLSGCLPMLLQMPILFAVFAFFPSCIELRGQSFLWVEDLSAPDAIVSWNAQIPFITNYFGNHISLFCILMTVTNILYTHLTMQSQSNSGMPGMKWMMYLMPIMFLVFFNNYSAGLSYYYFVSLLITIVQTYVIRHYMTEERVRANMAELAKKNASKKKKKGGFMERLQEMQKQAMEMQRQQQEAQRKAKKK